MALIVKETGVDFAPCPEGVWHAVCVDVVDMGMRDTPFGKKHKVKIVWETESKMEESGQPFIVMQTFGLSLHKQASLRKMLEGWRAKKFSEAELGGFDLEKLIGASCQAQIQHGEGKDGVIWANVQAVMPLSKGMTALAPTGNYIRVQDRPEENGGNNDDNDKPVF